MTSLLELALLLLVIGFLGGGGIALTAFLKPVVSDEQYREIRSNMRRAK